MLPVPFNISEDISHHNSVAESDVIGEPQFSQEEAVEPIPSINEDFENKSTTLPFTLESEENDIINDKDAETTLFDSVDLGKLTSSASIPAPSVLSPALQNLPGKVLVPAVVDQVQSQALAALQVLKVIENDVQPGDLCTRREYARWLVSASSALSRNTLSKVYPAMYIENVTELAFDDITPEDPDFSSIQGLAEAGLIASKLSRRDMNISNEDDSLLHFYPESPLSRQDLVSWKMSLEKRLLPVADKTILQQLSGFIDIDKINPDAWPALISDLSAGENGIVGLAFGYTRLFQPNKPVTNSQAAIALATGEGSDIVSEELARIEAESMAEKAVAAHTALVDQVQKDVNKYYENDLLLEREKIVTLEKIAEETKQELERLLAEQEEQNLKMMKERAAVDSQMEVLSKLRHEIEEELESILKVVEGMKLDRGYISPYFVTNPKNQKCELDDPLILIHEKKISSLNSIVKVLELALKMQRPLLIVAEDIESEALATLILNKLRAGIKVCAIKAPGFGENRKSNLQDLATLTGGEVITEELGMNIEKVGVEMLGTCKKVTVSKDDTVVLDGAGDKKAIEERCEQLRSSIELSTSDYDKEKFHERLAKLSGGVAVLKIGGASEAEVGEKKDRVTDALNATKAAVEEGIVPGGGVALLYASKELSNLVTANFDQKIGVQIIQNALKSPVHTIASNAGVEGAVVVGKLLEQDNTDLGYDAARGLYVDMVKEGIIDPVKVIRTALVDAASVSSLLTTTEAVVVELPKDEKEAPEMPGMGGYGSQF